VTLSIDSVHSFDHSESNSDCRPFSLLRNRKIGDGSHHATLGMVKNKKNRST